MAEVKKNVLGDYYGTLGNITFTSWKGRVVMRTKSGPKGEPTLRQTMTRDKFKAMLSLNKSFHPITKDSLKHMAIASTTMNVFFQQNLDVIQVTETLEPNGNLASYTIAFDYSKVKLTQGSYPDIADPAVNNTTGEIALTWNFGSSNEGASDDLIYLVAYRVDNGNILYRTANRNEMNLTINLPGTWIGKNAELFTFSSNKEKKQYSQTQHLGQLTLA